VDLIRFQFLDGEAEAYSKAAGPDGRPVPYFPGRSNYHAWSK
jgi:hypothetical protein